jgi:hypothetical protein
MPSDFESLIRETGLRLYKLVEGETPPLFGPVRVIFGGKR